ncbi:MAG: SRPBCC family protein [Candidatus Acidiferrales bacterium]
MKRVLIALAALIGAAVVVAIIGALLPQDHTASRRAQYRESPEVLWAVITDYQSFPTWRTTVKKVEPLPAEGGRLAWRETDKHGQAIPYEVVASMPPHKMMTRIADPKLPFGGTWTQELEPSEGGTTVRITENGSVYNPIFRFMSRFVFGYTATMDEYLRALGAKFGESVTPEN